MGMFTEEEKKELMASTPKQQIGRGWTVKKTFNTSPLPPGHGANLTEADKERWKKAIGMGPGPVSIDGAVQGVFDRLGREEREVFYGTGLVKQLLETPPEPTCEADKPEGTRDVDKYLKEQQNKLWGLD